MSAVIVCIGSQSPRASPKPNTRVSKMSIAFALVASPTTVPGGAAAARSIGVARSRRAQQQERPRRCLRAAASEEKEQVTLSPEDMVREQYKTTEAQDFGDSILGGASMVDGTQEETRDLVPFGANNLAVLRATKAYAEAIEADIDPSFIIADTLGWELTDDSLFLHGLFFCFFSFSHPACTLITRQPSPGPRVCVSDTDPNPPVSRRSTTYPPRRRSTQTRCAPSSTRTRDGFGASRSRR